MLAVNKRFDHTPIHFNVKHTYLLQSVKTKHNNLNINRTRSADKAEYFFRTFNDSLI